MCKIKTIILLLLFVPITLLSQTIELDLPSCQYLQYHLALKQGNKLDTIVKGRFDELGKASFTVPDKYASFSGVGQITVTATPKKWNIILNGEERLSLKEVDADSDKVVFSNSKENMALVDFMATHKKIVTEYNSAINSVGNQSLALALPQVRVANTKKSYKDFLTELRSSPLYAARMMEVMLCQMGTGNELEQSPEDILKSQQEFISNNLDFNILYTSGFWQTMLDLWFQNISMDDDLLLADSRNLLSRTEDIPVRRELTNSVIRIFSQFGKDNLLMELGSEYLTIPINGKPAPELITGGAPIQPKSCLIFFYDSDCGMCHNELHQLIEKYELLSNDHNGIEVIAVSADTNKDDFDYTAAKMPWKDKLYDPKGFAGENFANYGIVGTPTLILVDKEGIVRGRYARLSEFLKN